MSQKIYYLLLIVFLCSLQIQYLYAQTSETITGTIIGTSETFTLNNNNKANIFDGNNQTYYESSLTSNVWAGLLLKKNYVITKIVFLPRKSFAEKMVGGKFQGSNDPNYEFWIDLHEITSVPADDVLNSVDINIDCAFKFFRYLSPNNSSGNVATINFVGYTTEKENVKLTGIPIGTPQNDFGSTGNGQKLFKKENAFDGNNSSSYYAGKAPNTYVGLAFLAPTIIDSISFCPRSGSEKYITYGRFEGANKIDFSDATTLATIPYQPSFSKNNIASFDNTTTFLYARWFVPTTQYADASIAEIEFKGFNGADSIAQVLKAKITGTAATSPNIPENTHDNNILTYFSTSNFGDLGYLSYDFGENSVVNLKYVYLYTNSTKINNIKGSKLKAANSPDFSDAILLYSYDSIPLATGSFDTIAVSDNYRYVRLYAPQNYNLDVAEFKLYGIDNKKTFISKVNENPRLILFPNPANTFTTIKTDCDWMSNIAEIQIFDLQGREIKRLKIENSNTTEQKIDLRDLINGAYMLSLNCKKGKITKMLIVSKATNN